MKRSDRRKYFSGFLKIFENESPFDSVQKSSKLPDNVDLYGSKTNSKFVPLKLELMRNEIYYPFY